MTDFLEIKPEQITNNPFKMVGSEWMLITAEKEGKINTMTASWGGFGVLWNRNVAFVFIRPQRFTKVFVDGADTFSLSFLNASFKKKLTYLGTVSGRDEDKIKKSELAVDHFGQTPFFRQADLAIICKKLYAQPMEQQFFIDPAPDREYFPAHDYHTLYVAEITKILIKA